MEMLSKRALTTMTLGLAMLTPLSFGLIAPLANASSHREAPLIAQDPTADGTDFYMFRSPDKPDTVTLIANYIPLQARYGGPNFHHPNDNVRYEIKIDNDGNAEPDVIYRFNFWSERRASAVGGGPGDTYLYNDGPITSLNDSNLLFRQYYRLTRIDIDSGVSASTVTTNSNPPLVTEQVIAEGQVMPAFVGKQSYCAGDPAACSEAQAKTTYENIVKTAVFDTKEGGKVYVGPRQESFYVDLGKIFDLARLGSLNAAYGAPSNDTAEFNVTSLAIQAPIKRLATSGDPVIGAWTTASRQSVEIIGPRNNRTRLGPWVQVSRLGSPLVNEVVIGAKDKDKFNASEPKDDVASFGDYVVNPRIVKILNALYGLGLKETQRGDLVQAFVTGIPGVNRPKNLTVGGEMLRLNTAIPITPADKRSDLGILGVLQGNLDAQGFPNGRRVTDDVTDAELSALTLKCNGVNEGFGPTLFDANGQLACTGLAIGDGVSKAGLNFLTSFPYLPTPHSGTEPD